MASKKVTTLSVPVTQDDHCKVKVYCAQRGISMKFFLYHCIKTQINILDKPLQYKQGDFFSNSSRAGKVAY